MIRSPVALPLLTATRSTKNPILSMGCGSGRATSATIRRVEVTPEQGECFASPVALPSHPIPFGNRANGLRVGHP